MVVKRSVYFVTNRDPKPADAPEDFGSVFNPAGIDDLRFGRAVLTTGASGKTKMTLDTAAEQLNPLDQSKSPVLGSRAVFKELQQAMRTSGKDSLIFLHGYDVSFRDAVETAASLLDRHSARIGQIAIFSWPSNGRLVPWFSYKSDRTDARASGPALGRAMLKAADFIRDTLRAHKEAKKEGAADAVEPPCGGNIHLLAHSMGNYVLRHALQEIARLTGGSPRRVFGHVFMMAADEDDDCFEHDHKMKLLSNVAQSIHVYFNRGDRALDLSDVTKMNPNRLGSDGPHHPLDVPGNVNNIDVSDVVHGIAEHDYYVTNDKVRQDVNAVLRELRPDKVPGRRYLASQNRYLLKAK
jgi:esterase/lipase superfamily enzyme